MSILEVVSEAFFRANRAIRGMHQVPLTAPEKPCESHLRYPSKQLMLTLTEALWWAVRVAARVLVSGHQTGLQPSQTCHDNQLTFTSDRGQGDSASFTLRPIKD